MKNIHGVGESKAKKYGGEFIKVIEDYVDDNKILRNEEYTVKTTGSKSTLNKLLEAKFVNELKFCGARKAKVVAPLPPIEKP